jgi:cytochrome P450
VDALANCFYLMLTRPNLRARVTADRAAALQAFVEEAMRVRASV